MRSTPTRWPVRPAGVVAAVAAGVLLAGCGGSDGPESAASALASTTTMAGTVTAAPAAAGAVTVKQFRFMPSELSVPAGTTVTWTNEDEILHTATSGGTPGTADGQFDGRMDGQGTSFSHSFDQPGRYPYFCSRHESMTGTVVVE